MIKSSFHARPYAYRTHQIRIHLSGISKPILGDRLYGKEGLILRGKGLFLYATEVSFPHPIFGDNLHLKIDMPPKFLKFMEGEKRRYESMCENQIEKNKIHR